MTDDSSSRFVQNGPVRLHYLDSDGPRNKADAAPVVFVPGMTCVATDYRGILDSFGRRTIVVDLRGHGLSDSPASGYSLEHQVTDVAAVIDAVTDGPVHLMTFSRGTCYALGWAFRNAHRVKSISIGDYPARELALPAHAAESFFNGRWRGTPVADRVTREAALATFGDAVARPFWTDLAALDVPVLAVRSSAQLPLSDEDWEHFRTEIVGCEMVEFADAPHDLFRHDRLRYPKLVRSLVERTEAAHTKSARA